MTCTLAVRSPAQWLLQQAGQLYLSIQGLRICSSLSPSLRGAMLLLFPARILCISMLTFLVRMMPTYNLLSPCCRRHRAGGAATACQAALG